MVKGASIKFTTYKESVSSLLSMLKLEREIKKYDKIVIKVPLTTSQHPQSSEDQQISMAFVESVLRFVLENKNPVSEVFIAEGADGADTNDLFENRGFRELAERYAVSLIDLNEAETEETNSSHFSKFQGIEYPKILKESFVISISGLSEDPEFELKGSISSMLGAFPSRHYKGFFSSTKNKIRKWPIRYSIHDIIQCKVPDFAVIDASKKGMIMAGLPLEMDKQAAKLLGLDWKKVSHLKLLDDTFANVEESKMQRITS